MSIAGLSEKLSIFSKHNISVYFRPSNTLRGKTSSSQGQNTQIQAKFIVYIIECSEEFLLNIGETNQPTELYTCT